MQSATSRESYRAVLDRLAAYAAGADASAVVATGDEILAVADLLRREPRLRRALVDPARTGEERAGLLRGLLTGKVSESTEQLVTELVAGRWGSPSELLDAMERLGAETLLAAAERAGELAEVEDELFRFGHIVDGHPELAIALGDVTVEPARRTELVRTLLEGKAKAITIRLAELAVQGFGGRAVSAGLSRLVELAAERRDRQIAHVTVAAPLTEDEERQLCARLAEMYGREVTVKCTVDPSVLGGMSVLIGSHLYDGTVRRRLTDTRKALTGR
ncbi:MAG TPA: F0F1 ATP synthase subunit delta [Micromonospora sp.]|mgnify:CR=1 FL=1